MKNKALFVAFSLLAAHVASAAPITFDFINEGSVSSGTYSFTDTGLTITGKGYEGLTANPINLGTLAVVVKSGSSNGGLGVNSSTAFDGDTDNELDQSSSAGLGEGLLFSFSSRVKLESVTFTAVNTGDDFDFAFGDGAAPTGSFLLSSVGVVPSWNASAFNYSGTHFLFASIDAAGESGEDRFKISSITVSLAPAVTATPTAAVPESGSLLALLSGSLVALAWFARRQR